MRGFSLILEHAARCLMALVNVRMKGSGRDEYLQPPPLDQAVPSTSINKATSANRIPSNEPHRHSNMKASFVLTLLIAAFAAAAPPADVNEAEKRAAEADAVPCTPSCWSCLQGGCVCVC